MFTVHGPCLHHTREALGACRSHCFLELVKSRNWLLVRVGNLVVDQNHRNADAKADSAAKPDESGVTAVLWEVMRSL